MRMRDILTVSRPVTWIVFPTSFYLGMLYSGSAITIASIILMLSMSLPVCLAGYGINDAYDYETDKNNKRKGGKHGYIARNRKELGEIKRLAIISLLPFLIALLITGNLYAIIIGISFIIIGYLYSAPPIRLKSRPPLDSLSNGLIYGVLPLVMGFSMSGSFSSFPTYKILWLYFAVSMGHAVSTIPDYETDKKAGIRTFSIFFGRRTTTLLALLSFSSGLVLFKFNPILQVFLYFSTPLLLFLFFKPDHATRIAEILVYGFYIILLVYLYTKVGV